MRILSALIYRLPMTILLLANRRVTGATPVMRHHGHKPVYIINMVLTMSKPTRARLRDLAALFRRIICMYLIPCDLLFSGCTEFSSY